MKLLIMQFPPISRHMIPLWSNSPQHPVLKHPQSMFLDSKREDKRFWTELYHSVYTFNKLTPLVTKQ
jgi:hypothetical protein